MLPAPQAHNPLVPSGDRAQRAQWARDLQDLAPLMGPVAPVAVHPLPPLMGRGVQPPVQIDPKAGSFRTAPGVVWVDATSTQAALDPRVVGDPSRTATLVFGSARHPGGGWEHGATAQEEDVSLCSSWALAARQAPSGFYDTEHRWEGPHAGLWATGHWFARAPGDWLDDPVPAAFVGISAPNLKWAREQGVTLDPSPLARAHVLLVERLALALRLTAAHGCTTLVGGLIGTGVFGWSREAVLAAWGEAWRMRHTTTHDHGPASVVGRLVMAVPGWSR